MARAGVKQSAGTGRPPFLGVGEKSRSLHDCAMVGAVPDFSPFVRCDDLERVQLSLFTDKSGPVREP